MTDDKMLTAPEVAERLQCTRKTVHNLILSGRLPGAMRLDRAYRVPESALSALLVIPAVSVVSVPAPAAPKPRKPRKKTRKTRKPHRRARGAK